MTPIPAVRHEPEPAEDTDNLRAEEREARQEARFAALDRADRSGPTH